MHGETGSDQLIKITREWGSCGSCGQEDWNYWIILSFIKQGIWICRKCWRKVSNRMIQNDFPKKPRS